MKEWHMQVQHGARLRIYGVRIQHAPDGIIPNFGVTEESVTFGPGWRIEAGAHVLRACHRFGTQLELRHVDDVVHVHVVAN